jgi:hypothetical protein
MRTTAGISRDGDRPADAGEVTPMDAAAGSAARHARPADLAYG